MNKKYRRLYWLFIIPLLLTLFFLLVFIFLVIGFSKNSKVERNCEAREYCGPGGCGSVTCD